MDLPTQADTQRRILELDARAEKVTHEVAQRARAAADAEHAWKVGFAKAFLAAEGAMPLRKEIATVEAGDLLHAHLLASGVFDAAKEAGRNCRSQLEGQRSISADLRPLVTQ